MKRKRNPALFLLLTGAWLLACTSLAPKAAAQVPPPVFTTIHNFAGGANDGFSPYAPLIFGGKVLYGTTIEGGNSGCGHGCGTVFSLEPPGSPGGHWTEKILYSFTGGSDGGSPAAGLVIDAAGVLYGATQIGGDADVGIVFSLTTPAAPGGDWTETVLHSFGKGHDGRNPIAGFVIGKGGALYGTTAGGGAYGNGTVFALRPPASPGGPWTEKILHSFAAVADGVAPETVLAIDPASGMLYGTTNLGGTALEGTVFSLSPPATANGPWTEAVIYNFTGGDDGFHPNAVLLAPDGTLYGASHGIHNNVGAVFSLTPPASLGASWSLAVLHDFRGAPDGSEPDAGLVMGSDGTLYGTTISGGTGSCLNGCGVIFSMTPPTSSGGAWSETVLLSLNGAGNGPGASLTFGTNGALYGTTKFGGAAGGGTAFALAQ